MLVLYLLAFSKNPVHTSSSLVGVKRSQVGNYTDLFQDLNRRDTYCRLYTKYEQLSPVEKAMDLYYLDSEIEEIKVPV
jgi:hypothetical protein